MSQPKILTPGGDSTAAVDLNASGITPDQTFDVSQVDRVSIRGSAGTWTTAQVTLKRSVDKTNWGALSPSVVLTAAGSSYDIDVSGARFLALDVTTPEGGASTGTFDVYGFRRPARR